MLDAHRATRVVRLRAAEWKLDPNRIGIIGFSAGGHLASTAGTHFDLGDATAADDKGVPPVNSRMFSDALTANGVEATYLELPSGGHGLNGYQGPMWDAWQAQSLQ